MKDNNKFKRVDGDEMAEKVWSFILGYYTDIGYMPTLQEIADNFNRQRTEPHSRQWAHYYVAKLVKAMKIKYADGKTRGIELINKL